MASHLSQCRTKAPSQLYPFAPQGKFFARESREKRAAASLPQAKFHPAPRPVRFSWTVMMALAAGAARLFFGAASTAEDWPQWRGPRGDGTWNAPRLSTPWPPEGLRTRWKQPLGGGYAGVVVSGGKALTMDRQTEPEECERVVCFDLADGRRLWQHRYPVKYGDLDYGNGPRGAPTVSEGRVYTLGALGHAKCLDLATGQLVWQRDFVAEEQAVIPQWGLAASPVLYRDLAIFHAGVPGGCYAAFERATGRERWRADDDPAGYATPIVIQRRGQDLLVGWTPEHIVGISPDGGQVHWRIPYKVTYGVSIATPIYAAEHDLVLVSGYWEGSKAIRLGPRPGDAELAWEENDNLRGLMSQPLRRGELVYLLDKSHGLTCFELATGAKRWDDRHQLTPRGRNPQASLVWLGQGDEILALNSEGELVHGRLGDEGFRELSRAKIIGPTWAHPAFAGSDVLARSDEELVCVELPTAP